MIVFEFNAIYFHKIINNYQEQSRSKHFGLWSNPRYQKKLRTFLQAWNLLKESGFQGIQYPYSILRTLFPAAKYYGQGKDYAVMFQIVCSCVDFYFWTLLRMLLEAEECKYFLLLA